MRHRLTTTQQELFTEAYALHSQELGRYARSMVNDRELSEDLVQDVFVKMWLYLLRKGEIVSVRGFLYHVLNNLIVDRYRKHKTWSLDSLLEQGYEPRADDTDRLVDIFDGKLVFRLIDKLPDTYQEVLRMKYAHHLSYGEISKRTGQQRNTIAVQVHRGLVKLKELYNHPHRHTAGAH
jgi:RNA polymerase sigma factor (sigma-70 family)